MKTSSTLRLSALGFVVAALGGCAFDQSENTATSGGAGTAATGGGAGTTATGGGAGTAATGGGAGTTATGGGAGTTATGGSAGTTADPSSLPATSVWGPSFIGLAQDDQGRDIALGVVWDPGAVTVGYRDDRCIGIETASSAVVGKDVGTITVTGGANVPSQPLSRSAQGYYFLSGEVDVWRPNDELSLSYGSKSFGPLAVPSAVRSPDLKALDSVSRGAPLTASFSGTDATHVAMILSGAGADLNYLLTCVFQAADGTATVPAGAIASFPADAVHVDVSLKPINRNQDGDFTFMVSGPSVDASVPLNP